MEFLRMLARFVFRVLAIAALLAVAPAIFLAISVLVALHPRGDYGMLAFFYCAAGPFVSAVWTPFVCGIRHVYRSTGGDVRSYKNDGRRVEAGLGWMLYGFFGTLVAEVAFVLLFHCVSRSPVVFFAAAPFVVFAPLVVVCVWRPTRNLRA